MIKALGPQAQMEAPGLNAMDSSKHSGADSS